MRKVPFLWEIGCEEFPATWLPDTLEQLGSQFKKQLQQHGLDEAEVEVYGTLRRLVRPRTAACRETTRPP